MNNDFWGVLLVFLVAAALVCAIAVVSLIVKAVFAL